MEKGDTKTGIFVRFFLNFLTFYQIMSSVFEHSLSGKITPKCWEKKVNIILFNVDSVLLPQKTLRTHFYSSTVHRLAL